MKKIFIFLIIFFISLCFIPNVYASSFYEGDYIKGIYQTKEKNGTKYFQTARFFREVGTEKIAYCTEPFETLKEGSQYTETLNPDNLSAEQIKQISLLAHFGFGYEGRLVHKWYAVTQLLIWRVADPTGDYYFTDGLNGPRTNSYSYEIDALYKTINEYKTLPSFNGNSYIITEGEKLILTDENNVLANYSTDEENVKIENNTLIIDKDAGIYNINIRRKDNYYNTPLIFHQNSNSQDLVTYGDIEEITASIQVTVQKTEIKIKKNDYDTKSTIPSGEGILENAEYTLYNFKNEEIATLIIDENNTASITNIPYGNYTLRETKAPKGYELDENIYKIEITEDNPIVELTLENKIIKGTLVIQKDYGNSISSLPEKNVSFEIWDSKNKLVSKITTDENGYAKISLPYGTYQIKQVSTTEGYQKVDDFKVSIEENRDYLFSLYDYEIKVPNTYNENRLSLFPFILIFISYAFYKKRKTI